MIKNTGEDSKGIRNSGKENKEMKKEHWKQFGRKMKTKWAT